MSTGRHDWSDPPPMPGAEYIVQMRLFRLSSSVKGGAYHSSSEELVEVSVPIYADDDLDAYTKSGDAIAEHLRRARERIGE